MLLVAEGRIRNFFYLTCLVKLAGMNTISHLCDLCFASFSCQVCGRLKVEVSRISGTFSAKAFK